MATLTKYSSDAALSFMQGLVSGVSGVQTRTKQRSLVGSHLASKTTVYSAAINTRQNVASTLKVSSPKKAPHSTFDV